jgi:hypothetical protein|tara:strand:- start:12467 stop:13234 length:768 start_codon:yes stop_codon:yes gene_type:complete
MKNLIFQYFIPYEGRDTYLNETGIGFPSWVNIGKTSAEKYAKEIGAEYKFSDQKYMFSTLNVFESLRVIYDKKFDEYDNILILDIDMIINTKENIFDIPVEDIAMVHEQGCRWRTPVPGASFDDAFWNRYFNHPRFGVTSYAKQYLSKDFKWQKSKLFPEEPFAMYNGGLQLWTKEGRLKARKKIPRKSHDHFRESTGKTETPYLNMMLFHHKFNITELPTEWNKLNFQWAKDGDYGKITHFNDVVKDKMKTHGF